MVPSAAIPLGPMTPPALAVISQGLPSQTTLGSIPGNVVYSAIALPALQNERQNHPAFRQPANDTQPAAPDQARFRLAQLSGPTSSPNRSVAFFAQLLAQSDAETQAQLTQSFNSPVPTRPNQTATPHFAAEIHYPPQTTAKSAPLPEIIPSVASQSPLASAQQAYRAAAILRQGVTYTPLEHLPRPPRSSSSGATSARLPGDKQAHAAYAKAKARLTEIPRASSF